MEALDEVKEKIPEDAYLMVWNAFKEKHARLAREERAEQGEEQGEEQGRSRGGIQIILS